MSQPMPLLPKDVKFTPIEQEPNFTVQVHLTDRRVRLHTRAIDLDVVDGMLRIDTRDPDGEEVQVHFYTPGTWQEVHTMTAAEGEELASVFDYMHTNIYSHTSHLEGEEHL